MTDRQKELHEYEWNATYDDFCKHLKQGVLAHESWFRNQQKKSRAGTLSADKNEKLGAVLREHWESDHITGLRNAVRAGDIGIMNADDGFLNDFSNAVANIRTDDESLEQ